MDHQSTAAKLDEVDAGALKPHVYLAVEALRALGRIVAPPTTASGHTASDRISSLDVPLAAMRVLADALAEQIAHALRRTPCGPDQQAPSPAPAGSLTMEGFAERLEHHATARHSAWALTALTPAERIRRFIESHYAEPLTLEDIAGAIGCARSLVAATVKHHLGVTPHRYIVRTRIRRAAELITQGDKIEAVMLSVGYRGKKNFYRQFKAETGVTPAVYRRLRPAGESAAPAERAHESRAHWPDAPAPRSTAALAAIRWDHPAPSVTVSGASELLGVSRRTVYYWIKNGKLQTIRQLVGGQRVLVDSFSDVKTR